ncbi:MULTISPECIES: pectinesterase family protein [unclassified Streptomyces]|uniref:pectinesterase family protein n=1 Tax=unclassified Streptomyces TaxID=2593676 RepID=UPI000DBA724E|nr:MULTISPECIES: pectinesterase family protein [unclassified Streptomyces]MYT71081.1 pectin esterase [Streptomyces sp. SID8367]RAJ75818.1 pectinesterase [Streptomyces sp. PsTaAH-137]
MPLNRRTFIAAGIGLAAIPTPAAGGTRTHTPFGPYGSPTHRRDPDTIYVDPQGHGDVTTLRAATATTARTVVIAPGVYRETVTATAARTTWIGASGNPRDTVVVYDNAAGTQKPDGSGTYGTTGSATVTLRGEDFSAQDITFANDWLRADHPGITGTQAVALKVTGDRSAFFGCRFLGHQDTLYADSPALTAFARQYFHDCYVEGDVDFVFGRGTAVYDRCHFRTLDRTDLGAAPYGFVFAPSTAAANPRGCLVTRSRITSTAPDASYKLARPWVPSSDTTAVPSLVVRNSRLGAGLDAVAPYANMSDSHPWQRQRFAEYRNTGPGATVTVPENRPQLTHTEAESATPAAYLGDWAPRRARPHDGRAPRAVPARRPTP